MTRLPGTPAGRTPGAAPNIYTVLLIVGILFLLATVIVLCVDLFQTYQLSFAQLFSGPEIPS